MSLSVTEQRERVEAIILNRVEGLSWNYFDIELGNAAGDVPSQQELAVLERLVPHKGGRCPFRWKGSGDEDAALMRAVVRVMRNDPDIAEHLFRRIFDGNLIPNDSDADRGILGWFNRGHRDARNRSYLRNVKAGHCRTRTMIIAEGDSWFQFPSFGWRRLRWNAVRDIIDHLMEMNEFCVRSVASGGDWLSNMHRNREYIPELSRIEPTVFLFSGGGNDLMGGGRVGNMVSHPRRRRDAVTDGLLQRLIPLRIRPHIDGERYLNGVRLLSDEFFDFMNLVLVQYFLFFLSIGRSEQLGDTVILTQGYDFAVPRRRSTAPFPSARRLVNRLARSGHWLWVPLEEKQLTDQEKRDVIYAMITEFNELMIRLATECGFDRVYHMDFRGLAQDTDWYDEIHLTSAAFGRAAACIRAAVGDILADAPAAGGHVFRAARGPRGEPVPARAGLDDDFDAPWRPK